MHPEHFVQSHHFGFELMVLMLVFNALVDGMPSPTVNDKLWYVWLYRSLHVLLGHVNSAFGKVLTQSQSKGEGDKNEN